MRPAVLRRVGTRRAVVAGVATGLVLAGGVAAWSATGASAAASYRAVTVTRGSVEQTLDATGTVTPRQQARLSFASSGTVHSVAVATGDRVGIGDTLAVLDRRALRDAVTTAEAAVAKARATLAADTVAQAAAVNAASASDASKAAASASSAKANAAASAATRKTLARLAKQQASLISAQRAADLALQVSTAALSQQTAACAGVLAASDTTSTPGPDVAGCQTALGATQAAQAKVAAAQQRVEKAIATLTQSLSAALRTVSPSSSSPTNSSPNGSSSNTSTPTAQAAPASFASTSAVSFSNASAATPSSTPSDSPSSSSGTVTAATLARDQSEIDTQRAALVRAKSALDKARLTSPIAGTVASVAVAPGDSASSSTVAVVVNGNDGNVEVTINVTENDIRSIKVGQRAQVFADGAQAGLPARVTSIGLLGASDTGTASYPVVVSLAGAPLSLASGADASVSIVTATASNVVTVPSSAVTRAATGATGVVRVLVGDAVTPRRVQVGAVGPVRTQIVSGLKPGQHVVLADLSAALPSSSTSERLGGGFGGPGGFTVQRSGPASRNVKR